MKALIKEHRSKIIFLVVGGWNTLFGYAAFSVLYMLLSHRFNYTVILTISYVLAITNAYIGYKVFVFRTKGNVLKEYLRFYVVYGGAFVANIILLPVLMRVILLNAYVSQALIVILTVISSYIFHKGFTFKIHEHEE
ncbi:MAG TPA: GtrA family protein [Chlorobaculum sp.]|nr:GtrA family protein [Chlorobaculum sp.]